ncbi:unnamed protein product [Cylicocyclus nassatus]|uniref:Centrosome-associated FAM110 C-terminal domain-containing protein n=1 Tax=Cylicocyclus nassatus TaxID=53992 RepID=A0AA36M9R7_CYLNA|nr:unnamed protein product [Cylicocyclus nassatus]
MKCPLSSSPTAAEFLEATKKLYVKTDALIQRKLEPGQPRLFRSTDDEDEACYNLPSPSPSAISYRIPSKRSAFRVVRLPSTQSAQLQLRRQSSSPPPLQPRSTSLHYPSIKEPSYKPQPKPRLSLMRSMLELSMEEPERPQPKPRRKTLKSVCETVKHAEAHPISIETVRNSPLNYRRKITKSSPNLSAPSVAALKRRVHSLRAATPVPQTEEPNVMFPVMDESERDFLRAAVRLTYSTDDEDSDSTPSPSFGHASYAYNPGMGRYMEKCSPRSPTTDSGRPNSDDEDRRTHPCSTKSLDDGFFDSSFQKKDEDTTSEALTSVSNLQKVNDNIPEEETRDSHISILEKNARVMRWIRGCAVAPVTP